VPDVVFCFSEKPCNNKYIGILASALIGRTERGFDFLGYHFCPEGLAIAEKTLNNFVERAIRLYEQGPGKPSGSTRLGRYVKRWVRWAGSGLPSDYAAYKRYRQLAIRFQEVRRL
jgi:hypothetical protein